MMTKLKTKSKVRFLAGNAPRSSLLGLVAIPTSPDGNEVGFSRLYMVSPERWTHRDIQSEIVSLEFEDGPEGKCWWLLGKQGDIYAVRPTGVTQEKINDAGTSPGKLGYLSSIKLIQGRLYVCGFSERLCPMLECGAH